MKTGGNESAEFETPYVVVEPPRLTTPLVINSPHSGRTYSRRFLERSRLDGLTLRRSEDAFVDELLAPCVALGAPLMAANFPRAYLDVNREPYELDPLMFEGRLPPFVNTRSLRVAGGLGTIPRVVGEAQEIYGDSIPVAEAMERIAKLYAPYHSALRGLIERAAGRFGLAVLLDCHSMPSNVADSAAPDFVIGDRYGASAALWVVEILEQRLRQLGYSVRRNKPYAGGFITEHYGNPASGLHAIQLELNRAIYMDERRREKSARFDQVAADFAVLAETLATVPFGDLGPSQAAAE